MTHPNDTAGELAGGLWIRVAADLSDRKVTWRLVEMIRAHHPAARLALGGELPLGILRAAAAGYLVELWGNIAKHTADGVIRDLPPTMLEHWAGWDGEPGAFHRWVMAHHFDGSAGTVKEWRDYQGAIQERRRADAARQRDKRQRDGELRRELAGIGDAPPAPNAPALVLTPGDPFDAMRVARRLVVAANKGMEANPLIGGLYMPIDSSRGDSLEVASVFHQEGVTDFEILARVVYTLAKAYKPRRPGDQIRSLTFFTDRGLKVWREHVDRESARTAAPFEEISIDTKPTPAGRAVRSAAGARAAAASIGMPEDEE